MIIFFLTGLFLSSPLLSMNKELLSPTDSYIIDIAKLSNSNRIHKEIEFEDDDLCEAALAHYFKQPDLPLYSSIKIHLKPRLKEVQTDPEHKEAISSLIDLAVFRRHTKQLTGSSDSSSSNNKRIHDAIHNLVMESVQDAYMEKNKEVELKLLELSSMKTKLESSSRKTWIAALSNIVTALVTGGLATAVSLTVHFVK